MSSYFEQDQDPIVFQPVENDPDLLDRLHVMKENNILVYDNGIIVRINPKKIKSSMRKEFVYILSSLFPTWDKDDWVAVRFSYESDAFLHDSFCICTQTIHNLCIIQHVPTHTLIQVGIDCIQKINEETYDAMLKLKKKEDKNIKEKERQEKERQEYNSCLECKTDITNQRLKYPLIKICWTCRDLVMTNKCKKCDKKIQSNYIHCYTCK